MKLIHFENPDSKLADGSCCDATESSITLCGSCEYYFKFCLSDIGSNNCNLSSVTTSVLTSANYYIFQPSFPSQPCDQIISNPLVIPVQRWMVILCSSLFPSIFQVSNYATKCIKTDYLRVGGILEYITLCKWQFSYDYSGNVHFKNKNYIF